MSLTDAIRTALDINAPGASQQEVQEIVARRLDELSPGASIKRTGYFNHSWVPDLVVKWREDDDRPVFFRFDVKDESFDQDLEYLSPERPFFLDLIDRPEVAEGGSGQGYDVKAALRTPGRDNVLVSEVSAIDRLEDGVREHREVRAATRQVVVGGTGLVDESAATSIVDSWNRASNAAVDASSVVLRDALNEVEQYLDRIARLDLEAGLRSTWVSSGHDAETFPGSEDWQLDDRGPREIAELVGSLAKRKALVSPAQWDAIARAIDLSSLGHELSHLGRSHEGGPVNDLMRAGMRYWTARFAYVPTLESDALAGAFDWSFGKYALAINLVRRQAYFTDNGLKWNNMPKAQALPELRDRLEALDAPGVLGAGIQTPEERVSHELRSTSTKSIAEHIEPIISREVSWRSARLQWLELRVPGTELSARVNFSRNLVTADASIPLRTYVLLVGKYVTALNDQELAELTESLDAVP